MYCCSWCRRAVCTSCLVVPEQYKDAIVDDAVEFCCPRCHELGDRETGSQGKRAFHPYWASLFVGGNMTTGIRTTPSMRRLRFKLDARVRRFIGTTYI